MPRGRKIKLTDDVLKLIKEAKRLGLPTEMAAQYAGVAPGTVSRWLMEGREDIERKRESQQRVLCEALQKAEADRIAESLLRIREAAQGGVVIEERTTTKVLKDGSAVTTATRKVTRPEWTADAWVLERTHPNEFGQRLRTELSGPEGGAVQVNSLVDLMKEADKAEEEEKRQKGGRK